VEEREENECAWKYNFREAYQQAIREATPYWEAAKLAEKRLTSVSKRLKN
jgi:type I restriction enzyme M protein